jgi:hypothetical protein
MRALFFALTVALAQPALAAPVDLSGTWVLDKQASEDLDPILQASGASWLERQAAKGVKVTRIIKQDGDTLHIEVDSSAKDSEETVTVDGVSRQRTSDRGRVATVTHRWDGDAWVSESVTQDEAGQTVRVTQTNTVSADGATMTTTIRLERGSDAPIAVDRVYRRQ